MSDFYQGLIVGWFIAVTSIAISFLIGYHHNGRKQK